MELAGERLSNDSASFSSHWIARGSLTCSEAERWVSSSDSEAEQTTHCSCTVEVIWGSRFESQFGFSQNIYSQRLEIISQQMGGPAGVLGDRAGGAVEETGLYLGVSEQNSLAKVNPLVQ